VARTRSDNPYAIKALRRGIPNVLTFLAALPTVAVRAQEPDKPASRVEATAIITNARKIVTPNGVERLEKVRIGRIEQWVSIRGADRRNPVLLLIHGGPGYVSMPMSWWLSRGWEEYFTKFAVPLILFDGHHDRTVNSEVAATWFDTVKRRQTNTSFGSSIRRTCR
jgi:hypothetical protein